MKIALIHPTRGRSERAYNTSQRWLSASSGNHEIKHILIVDTDDPEQDTYVERFKTSHRTLLAPYYDKVGSDCVKATNAGARIASEMEADILVFLADDFEIPLPQWDEKIIDAVVRNNVDINSKWILKVDDGCQNPENTVITMPIMSHALYNELGYMWHREYKSMWVDVDLYFVCKPFIIPAYHLKFQHVHPSWSGARGMTMDETYNRSSANWNQGADVFNRRNIENNWGATPAQKV